MIPDELRKRMTSDELIEKGETTASYLEQAAHVAILLPQSSAEDTAIVTTLMAFFETDIDNLPDEVEYWHTGLVDDQSLISAELAHRIGECVKEIRQMAQASITVQKPPEKDDIIEEFVSKEEYEKQYGKQAIWEKDKE